MSHDTCLIVTSDFSFKYKFTNIFRRQFHKVKQGICFSLKYVVSKSKVVSNFLSIYAVLLQLSLSKVA